MTTLAKVSQEQWQDAAHNFSHEQYNPVEANHFAVMQIVVGGETVNGQIKGGTVVGQAIYRKGSEPEYWLAAPVEVKMIEREQVFLHCLENARAQVSGA